jgi:gas vesicle protein
MTMPHTTTDNKPLYAVAGLADLAVEKLRALPTRVPAITERAESAATTVRAKLSELPADVQKLRAELPADVQKLRDELPASIQRLRDELSGDVQKLRDDVPTILHNAQTRLVKFSGEVADAYDGLSDRGESAVKRFRNERAGELESVTAKVADAADKAADAADKMADELEDETPAKPKAGTTKIKSTKAGE